LPNALVITAENDVLRDEGEAYARKLWEAGVRVTCTRYVGTIHDFVMLNDIADAPAARSAIAQANDALISALQQQSYQRRQINFQHGHYPRLAAWGAHCDSHRFLAHGLAQLLFKTRGRNRMSHPSCKIR
jgi:dienelactone hydrolase